MNTQTAKTILMLPPEALLADDNIRFGLKTYRVNDLAQRILDLGGIQTNLKVETLDEPGPHGEKYKIREGHYRRAAVVKLNKDGAGILLPCEVEEPLTGLDRVMHQLSENMDRENLSPMDLAIVIRKMLDGGMSKVDIRNRIVRPGGRKGLAMQPMSNSLLNIYVSFLEFPKPIQNKIHDGTLPVNAAYELTKQPREKWETILERAEKDRQAGIDTEEKMEERYLEGLKKAEEREAKAKADVEALEKAKALAESAEAQVKERLEAAASAYAAAKAISNKDKGAKAKAEEAFKAKEADAKTAMKAAEEAKAAANKLAQKEDANQKAAAERAAKLADARKEASKADKKVRPEDVVSAATRVSGGLVPLKGNAMLTAIHNCALPNGAYPKTQKVFQAIKRCFNSEITEAQLLSEVAYIVGDKKEKPKHVKAG